MFSTQADNDNTARSAIETYIILATNPPNFVAYVATNAVTTWTGQVLGTITHKGPAVPQAGFTSTHRRWIRVRLVNGATYGGWSQGTGIYIKLRRLTSK